MNMLRMAVAGTLGALALSAAPPRAGAADRDVLQKLEDRAEIQALLVRYVTALDTRDADAYAGVFTEDAVFDVAGNVRHGRSEIRAIITGLQQNSPQAALYHVMTNTSVEIIDAHAARHQSYWQTVRAAPDGRFVVGAMGRYEDELVKVDGEWLIRSRKLTSFTQ